MLAEEEKEDEDGGGKEGVDEEDDDVDNLPPSERSFSPSPARAFSPPCSGIVRKMTSMYRNVRQSRTLHADLAAYASM